jgi:hypothetical protein
MGTSSRAFKIEPRERGNYNSKSSLDAGLWGEVSAGSKVGRDLFYANSSQAALFVFSAVIGVTYFSLMEE